MLLPLFFFLGGAGKRCQSDKKKKKDKNMHQQVQQPFEMTQKNKKKMTQNNVSPLFMNPLKTRCLVYSPCVQSETVHLLHVTD